MEIGVTYEIVEQVFRGRTALETSLCPDTSTRTEDFDLLGGGELLGDVRQPWQMIKYHHFAV